MTQKVFLYFSLLMLVSCCTKNEKTIIPDKRNFSIVNLNQNFPIIDLEQSSHKNDSLGLTCDKCVSNDNKKMYFTSVIIDGKTRGLEFHFPGWGTSYTFHYDKNNRIKKQKVTSCYNWIISYNYLDTLGLIYQFSKVDSENEIDTTSYKLDSYGRVTEVKGIEYGDLNKRSLLKKISYSGTSSIPDSINSVFENNKKIVEVRKEVFFQSKDKIDSILVEETKSKMNYTEKYAFINYFDKNEKFVSQKLISSKFTNNTFFVEKLERK